MCVIMGRSLTLKTFVLYLWCSNAKSKVGVFSTFSVEETRDMFWTKFNQGELELDVQHSGGCVWYNLI